MHVSRCTGPSADLSLSPSNAALLVPRKRHGIVGHIDVKPVIIKAGNGAISITPDGHIVLHDDTSLTILTVDEKQPFSAIVEQALPRFAVIGEHGGFALVASRDKPGHELPVRLSAVPIHPEAWNTPHTDVQLSAEAVRSLLNDFTGREAVLVSAPLKAFATLSCEGEETVSIRVSPPGAQVILAPLHDLVTSEADAPISLALLSSSVSASIEVIESVSTGALVLLTPPPSPPPTGRSSAFPITSSPPRYTRPNTPPSDPPAADDRADESAPGVSYTPPTPTSPPLREESEFFTKEDVASVALVPHHSANLVRGGMLRFMVVFMSWLLHTSLAKMGAVFGGNLLFWLIYKVFGMDFNDKLNTFGAAPAAPPAPVAAISEATVEDDTNDASGDEKMSDAETLLETDVATADVAKEADIDSALGSDERKEHAGTKSIGNISLPHPNLQADPQNAETPFARTPISIQPPPRSLRKEKSRFVADVRSDTVTLLVRNQSGGTNVPELKFIANGDRVPMSAQFDEVVQLSPDTRLIELRLPAARLEVSLA